MRADACRCVQRRAKAWAPRAFKRAARAPTQCPRALKVAARAPAQCPKALQVAARAPARCPRAFKVIAQTLWGPLPGAPGRSEQLLKLLVGAPGRSKWMLKPLLSAPGAFGMPGRCPRALEVGAEAPAQCPRTVRNAFRAPTRNQRSSLLLLHRAFEEAFKEAVRRSGSATLSTVILDSVLPHTVHVYALLGAPGLFGTPFRAPTRSHRVARACFCATGRSKMRSKKLFEEAARLH